MSIRLVIADDTLRAPNLLWDTTWDGFTGDWAAAGIDSARRPLDIFAVADVFALEDVFAVPVSTAEPSNNGGLRARAPLHTAILLCLMSDRRAEAEDVIPDGSGDPRGWAGDAIDSSLAPLGSRLWLLRRSALTPATAALAEVYAREALQTLVDQKVAASIDVETVLRLEAGRLELGVSLYREGGGLAASMNFWLLWDLSNGILDPLAR
jgi:phage gp46-like protein